MSTRTIVIGVIVVILAAVALLTTNNDASDVSPAGEIQYLLAQKYHKPLADVTVQVTKQNGNFIAGSVSFAAPGLPTPGEGGMFLAVKETDVWRLVYDGNGSIDCSIMKNIYHFPTDVLVGFCD